MRRLLLALLWGTRVAGAPVDEPPLPGEMDPETGLSSYPNCTLVETPWGDGDSFRVRFPGGVERTIRLYGVDCFETRDDEESDRRRLRAQRRYFGISKSGGNAGTSIERAKEFGKGATARVAELLRKPFTVHTSWADGRGDPSFKRYYGFVTESDGRDLGTVLVREGLARAFGVTKARSPGVSQEEYRQRLHDQELAAASRMAGAWELTNWEALPEERRVERAEEEEENAKQAPPERGSINPNVASRDELMRLPGVGEVTALRIMEEREKRAFHSAGDLQRVSGIGEKTVKNLAPYLVFPAPRVRGE